MISTPPTISCGLKDNNVRVGDQVEIVCRVTPNDNNIDDVIYENIKADGTKRNVSDTEEVEGFNYNEVRLRGGEIV